MTGRCHAWWHHGFIRAVNEEWDEIALGNKQKHGDQLDVRNEIGKCVCVCVCIGKQDNVDRKQMSIQIHTQCKYQYFSLHAYACWSIHTLCRVDLPDSNSWGARGFSCPETKIQISNYDYVSNRSRASKKKKKITSSYLITLTCDWTQPPCK